MVFFRRVVWVLLLVLAAASGCKISDEPAAGDIDVFESPCESGSEYITSEACRRWFWTAHDRVDFNEIQAGTFYYCPPPRGLYQHRRELRYRQYLQASHGGGAVPVESPQFKWDDKLVDFVSRFRVAGKQPLEKQHRALVNGEWVITVDDQAELDALVELARGDLVSLARAIGWLHGWELVLPSDVNGKEKWAKWVYPPQLHSVPKDARSLLWTPMDRYMAAVYKTPAGDPVALTHIFQAGNRYAVSTARLPDCMVPGQVWINRGYSCTSANRKKGAPHR